MSLDTQTVQKIARLASLALREQEIEQYTHELDDILNFVQQLNDVNTDEVTPLANPLDNSQRLRDDIVTESDQHELFQQHAPAVAAGLYLVPQVIETSADSE